MSQNKSLANKYRPTFFTDVIGQDHIIDILKAKIQKQEQSSHNYIFYGPRGTGKTSTARLFAKAINATSLDEQGKWSVDDPHVKAIHESTTMDYVEIDAASHTGVDNIREEIIAKVPYPPTMLKKKVYVIDEVHMLSAGAFNALLKTIEEPKEYVVFILATTEIQKVPETIISRCQVFNFKRVSEEDISNHLENIAQQESISYQPQALKLIASMADGGVRDAIKYLDQISILGNVDEKQVSKFLGIASEKVITDFLQAIKSQQREKIFAYIDEISQSGIDLYHFTKQIVQYIDIHLMEDVDNYLQIAKVCGEILNNIRQYPYPAIVYKIAYNNYINPTNQSNNQNTNDTNNTPSTPIPQTNTDTNSTINKIETPDTQEETPNTIEQNDKKNTPSTETDIKAQILNKLPQGLLKDTISKQTDIQQIDDHTIQITTISNIANIMLQKAENIQHIEQIAKELYQKGMQIKVSLISKDDYLQTAMQQQ